MMRLFMSALTAALCFAGPTRAQDYALTHFESFREICLANGADPEKAVATAEARGWRPAPRELAEPFTAEMGPGSRVMVNMRGSVEDIVTSPRAALLMIGVMPKEATELFGGDLCTLLPIRSEWEDATQRLSDWFGFAPMGEDDNGDPIWVYTESEGRPVSATDLGDVPDERYIAMLRAQQHYLVGLVDFDGDPGMMMVRAVL